MLFFMALFIVLGLCGLGFYKVFGKENFGWNTDTMVPLVIISLTATLLASLFIETKYTLSKTHLFYSSGPIKGEIEIRSIQKIKKNTSLYMGVRPFLATSGLMIYYNTMDEVFISPDSSHSFIEKLVKINPSIQVLN